MPTQAELAAMFEGGSPAQQDLAAAFESAAPRERSISEELMRQLGLTARAGIEGVGAIPNMIGDVVGLNSSKGLSDLLTRAGLPVPEGDIENLSQSVVKGGASSLLPIGVGAQLAKAGGTPATRGVGQMLAKDAGKQVALSGVAGGAADIAAQSGADELGQLGAGIGSTVLASLLARGAAPIARSIHNIADSTTSKGATRAAGRVAVDVSKDRAGAVARALREGEPVETAAQAAVPAGSAEFAGLEAMVAGRNPSIYGPDGTIVKSQAQYIDELWKGLQASTRSLREAELAGANVAGDVGERLRAEVAQKKASLAAALQIGGKAATESAQQAVLADRPLVPVEGMPRLSSRYSHNTDRVPEWASTADDATAIAAQRRSEAGFKERQLESIAAHGMKPLTVESIIGNIDQKLSTPGLRSSDTANTVLSSFKDKILATVGPNGIIDSRDLYTIRKEMGNKIKVLARQEQWDKALTEGLVHDVQHSIDRAIGGASGSLRRDGTSDWTDYLKRYSEGAKRIEGITERQDIAKRMGNAGREEAQRIFNAEGTPVTLPNLLSRPMMVANAMIRFLEGKGGQATRNELSRLMQPQNKEELARVMEMEMAIRGGKSTLADMMKRAGTSGLIGGSSPSGQ